MTSHLSLWFNQIIALSRPLRTRIRIWCYGAYSPRYYPEAIFSMAKGVINSSFSVTTEIPDWKLMLFRGVETKCDAFTHINLAGYEIELDSLSGVWCEDVAIELESEVRQALHRFHWLLVFSSKGGRGDDIEKMLDQIDDWIKTTPVSENSDAWQPYTVSERICNWVIFWCVVSHKLDLDKADLIRWKYEIHKHLKYLAMKLEYPANGQINNHLLNNARALYIGGYFSDNREAVELGKEIFKQHLPQMVGDGYLLEGSSHYHFLLTRSIEEVVRVARWSADYDFMDWMHGFSSRMQEAAARLVPPRLLHLTELPRIGDVSPDISFDWFTPRHNSDDKGWQRVWGGLLDSEVEEEPIADEVDGWLVAVSSGWYALTYSHPGINGYPQGHAHDDFGSACVYYEGRAIFVDIGRISYAVADKDGANGAENRCHNTVIVDDMAILPVGRGFQSVVSAEARRKASCRLVGEEGNVIAWEAKTMAGVGWKRQLSLSKKKGLHLRDDFVVDGNDSHLAEGFYYFAPSVQVMANGDCQWLLCLDGEVMVLRIDGAVEAVIEEAFFFPSYGQSERTSRLHWRSNVRGRQRVVLSVNQSVKNEQLWTA